MHLDTLDNIVAREGIQQIDVIKTDIEGAELKGLRGALFALAHFRPTLLLELFNKTLEAPILIDSQLLDLLIGCGYKLYSLEDSGVLLSLVFKAHYPGQNMCHSLNTENGLAV